MEQRRRATSISQLELLFVFLEGHKDLALGRVRSKEARAISSGLWQECAALLNVEGPARTGKEWAKVWNDFKCRVRAKLVTINANQQDAGGRPSTCHLTPLEKKAARILGRDVGPQPGVQQDLFHKLDITTGYRSISDPHQKATRLRETQWGSPTPIRSRAFTRVRRRDLQQESPSYTTNRATRMREVRRLPCSCQRPTPTPSERSELDESQRMALEIERIRAEVSQTQAQTMASFAGSFRLIAESIDRFSRKYCGEDTDSDYKINV